MTTEEKKELLWAYQTHVRRVKEIEEEIRRLRLDRMCPPPMQGDGMPRGGGKSDLSDYAVRLSEKIEKLQDERASCEYEKKSIVRAIKKVRGRYEMEVLFWRYIGGMSWDDVAEKVGASKRQVLRYHGQGLIKIQI